MTLFSIKNLSFLSQRIKSSAMQRMTAKQSACRPGETTQQPVLLNRFARIFGARRGESAGRRQPWRNHQLIGSKQLQSDAARESEIHLSAPRRATSSLRSSSKPRSLAERRGFNTKSKPLGITMRDVRRISRTLLFTRFLSCALPSFRGVVRPNRLYSRPFFRANNTKERETRFAPPSYTLLNCAAFLSRKSLGNAFDPTRATVQSTNSALLKLFSGPYRAWLSVRACRHAFSSAP